MNTNVSRTTHLLSLWIYALWFINSKNIQLNQYLSVIFHCSYLIRPSSLSPQASPMIDERKRHHQRTSMKREEPTGAEKGKETPVQSSSGGNNNEVRFTFIVSTYLETKIIHPYMHGGYEIYQMRKPLLHNTHTNITLHMQYTTRYLSIILRVHFLILSNDCTPDSIIHYLH